LQHLETSLIQLMDAAMAVIAGDTVASEVQPVLVALHAVLDADVAGFYWHEVLGVSWPVTIVPPDALRAIPSQQRGPHSTALGAQMHPGWRVCMEAPADPFRLSDVVSDLAWRASPMAVALRPYWGVHRQLAIPIYSSHHPTTFWVWALARQGSDFTASHRDLARRIRPALTRVTRAFAEASTPRGGPDVRAAPLNRRELLVVDLVARNQTAVQIARELGISPRTVNKHLEHVYRKLGVHDRSHALHRVASPPES
jgi:DNA-binding CsgD family transcriptional regulator